MTMMYSHVSVYCVVSYQVNQPVQCRENTLYMNLFYIWQT